MILVKILMTMLLLSINLYMYMWQCPILTYVWSWTNKLIDWLIILIHSNNCNPLIGARPVEDPYILTGQILTVLYFLYYIINPLIIKVWDNILYQ